MRKKQLRKDNRPCEFFDTHTLEYYITTNRDGLAEAARAEWRKRWRMEYPHKEGEMMLREVFKKTEDDL